MGCVFEQSGQRIVRRAESWGPEENIFYYAIMILLHVLKSKHFSFPFRNCNTCVLRLRFKLKQVKVCDTSLPHSERGNEMEF